MSTNPLGSTHLHRGHIDDEEGPDCIQGDAEQGADIEFLSPWRLLEHEHEPDEGRYCKASQSAEAHGGAKNVPR